MYQNSWKFTLFSKKRFVVVSLARQRQQTTAAKRTLNPVWDQKEATFDFPIYRSVVSVLGALELVLWDKDKFRKDYLGEVALPLEEWFKEGQTISFTDPKNEVCNLFIPKSMGFRLIIES